MAGTTDAAARFTTTIEQTGETTTGIRVPEDVIAALGAGKRPRVVVTLGTGFTYRTTVGSHDGSAFLSVSKAIREEAGVAGGETVEVQIATDNAPQIVEVPADLEAALRERPEARAFFEGLTASQQRGFTTSVTGAKQAPTRARRVEAAVQALLEGRKRP